MAKLAPSGHVIEGKFKGKEVYVWTENQSLMIHNGLLNNGAIFGSPVSYRLYEINTSSIVDYQEMGSTTQNANPEAVMKVGFWFGAVAAVAANQVGTQEIHTVAIEYPNGERSLLEINSFAYRTFKSIAFVIDEKKRNQQANTIPNVSIESHKETPVTPKSDSPDMHSYPAKRQIRINTDNLGASIKRAFMYLEDEEWDTAIEYFESILDIDPEYAEAYLGIAMAKIKCPSKESFAQYYDKSTDLANISREIKRAKQFADEPLATWLSNLDRKKKEEVSNKLANTSVITSKFNTVALKKDGTVFATGHNNEGQCEVSDWQGIIAVDTSGYHTIGLKSDGTVIATGKNSDGQCDVNDWHSIIAVQVGVSHTVGLKSDGTVVATGSNKANQCDVSSWNDIVAIAVSNHHTVGLKSNGTVVATGSNIDKQCDVANWEDIKSIEVGPSVTVGIKSDGTVIVAGPSKYFNVSNWKDITSVSAGDLSVIGVRSNGTVVATGINNYNECNVGNWININTAIAGTCITIGLKSNGTVISVGDGYIPNQFDFSRWSGIVALSANISHVVGIKADGQVLATGSNTFGECNVEKWKLW